MFPWFNCLSKEFTATPEDTPKSPFIAHSHLLKNLELVAHSCLPIFSFWQFNDQIQDWPFCCQKATCLIILQYQHHLSKKKSSLNWKNLLLKAQVPERDPLNFLFSFNRINSWGQRCAFGERELGFRGKDGVRASKGGGRSMDSALLSSVE